VSQGGDSRRSQKINGEENAGDVESVRLQDDANTRETEAAAKRAERAEHRERVDPSSRAIPPNLSLVSKLYGRLRKARGLSWRIRQAWWDGDEEGKRDPPWDGA
jgi:hypothetical protein